ncbi:hypothetical protein GH714_004847 [Hevea brasiliensis]|uniref:Glycoside hydrolase family 5 domain-containing protein n=1 Tax=Hevea brasiliensis TaxID=3981 RepID=A0A6A6LCR9_HEVBR|nr:hypothetical protein GH714_004847 [Hevea brasiliensis]
MLAEGLQEQPLKRLVSQLVKHRFNCVRFTWATFMFTRYANLSVSESFDSLNLTEAKAGIAERNPSLLSKTLVQAFATVIDELGAQGVMAVLDCQVSKPTWCCGETDGNAFFGDTYFDVREWLQGLTIVAEHFRGKHQVIAISTRNELRGPLSNTDDWYKYIFEGASAIHKANPDVLIFASGLSYANDLTFLREKPLGSNFDNKLVYEAHWYPWSWDDRKTWDVELLNEACYRKTQHFINQTGFTNTLDLDNPVPLFVGEFGLDQRGLSRADDHFLSCFLAYASEIDLDWGLWGFQGSYYFRENKTGMEETFGVMNYLWNRVRSPQFQNRLQLIKNKLQDPTSKSSTSYIIFHPQSGSCVDPDGRHDIYAGNCKKPKRWLYAGNGAPIRLKGTSLCLEAVGDGAAPVLSKNCSSQQSSWKLLSQTKLHVATLDETGEYLCLQKESPYTSKIVTSKCTFTLPNPQCLTDSQIDPTTQWFKLVSSNVL